MKTIETELCSYSVEAVRTAAREGVTRVELCDSPALDGITPSHESMVAARRAADGVAPGRSPVELFVMIRPRGGDFVYSDDEFEEMKRQTAFAKESGADGVVFGLLTPEGDVDTARTRQLVELAHPMESTFHRAFDVSRNWRGALEDIVAAGCHRILTSGQQPSAHRGIETIGELVLAAAGRIEIMAGAGVDPGNGAELAATGVDALHFSAKTVGDPAFVREMVAIARRFNENSKTA